MKKHNFAFIPTLFSSGDIVPGASWINAPGHPPSGPTVSDHIAVMRAQLKDISSGDWGNVLFANSHTGSDSFTAAEANELFAAVTAAAKEFGCTVHHESHRARILYSPWVSRDILPANPDLTLTADLSHWTVVSEAGPTNPTLDGFVRSIAHRFRHIHARIGYEEGPQVTDPAAPEWAAHVEGFLSWWEAIWAAAAARGDEYFTVVPEHGPPGYQHTMPYTHMPLADIWRVNHWVAQRVAKRYSEIYGAANAPAIGDLRDPRLS